MSGKSSIEIVESKAELQNKLKQERNAKYQQKLQVLYLMKVEGMSITQIASSMGKNRTTIHRWLEQYQNGGIAKMLTTKPKSGRPRQIPAEAVAKLKAELEQGEGFNSYKQVQAWLAEQLGFDNLDQLQDQVDTILDSLSLATLGFAVLKTIASLIDYDFIIDALSVAFL